MYQVFAKCDHVSPADVKMGRANEITVWDTDGEPVMYVHLCNSCKAVLGNRYNKDASFDD
jgi:hypothetical protein